MTGGAAKRGKGDETAQRVALVTGASKGVGRGIAIGLARAGFDVFVNFNGDATGADETAAAVVATGRKAWTVQADVGDGLFEIQQSEDR